MISIGDRMKANYENRYRFKLTRRTPVIIRLDGNAFHTLTRGCEKPFDECLHSAMIAAAMHLIKNIQGVIIGYIQSDEISILVSDFKRLTSESWFDYNIQKMTSISAAMASVAFSNNFTKDGIFDSRVFNLPRAEVVNYFVWRQRDWERNSVQMLGQAHFSHKQLQNKKCSDIHGMLHGIGINWAHLDSKWKNGTVIRKGPSGWVAVGDMVFTEYRAFVEASMEQDE